MITSGFDYHAPGTVAEAIGLLTSLGDEAKILAGGHSLLPMMKLRLAEPAHLIDLANIHELRGIQSQGDVIRIGAMTTENELINSPLIREKLPLLAEAARQIADPQVRNRGTIGGDIAHADPANDQPAIAMALDATLVLQGARGIRRVAAVDFFYGPYMTVMQSDELLVCLEMSPMPSGAGCAYRKLKRKTGDWATAGAAVVLQRSGDVITKARIGLTNVAPTPLRATAAEQLLVLANRVLVKKMLVSFKVKVGMSMTSNYLEWFTSILFVHLLPMHVLKKFIKKRRSLFQACSQY